MDGGGGGIRTHETFARRFSSSKGGGLAASQAVQPERFHERLAVSPSRGVQPSLARRLSDWLSNSQAL
jgi:hypothetical protein